MLLITLTTGCGHWRDQAMIDAGIALVPPETSVIGDSDNEGAIGILTGDYQAYIYFFDAGLGPEELVDAFAAHGDETGWSERYRCRQAPKRGDEVAVFAVLEEGKHCASNK